MSANNKDNLAVIEDQNTGLYHGAMYHPTPSEVNVMPIFNGDLYCDIVSDIGLRYTSAPPALRLMQKGLQQYRNNDIGMFVVGVMLLNERGEETSAYFISPNPKLWVNGLDGQKWLDQTITLFESPEAALQRLETTFPSKPSADRAILYQTVIEHDVIRLKYIQLWNHSVLQSRSWR
jgi:hypothetical protein